MPHPYEKYQLNLNQSNSDLNHLQHDFQIQPALAHVNTTPGHVAQATSVDGLASDSTSQVAQVTSVDGLASQPTSSALFTALLNQVSCVVLASSVLISFMRFVDSLRNRFSSAIQW